MASTETRTEVLTETEEVDEDVLDLGLGEDEDFFFDEEQEEETVKENKTSSSTHQRKTPLQTENLTSVTVIFFFQLCVISFTINFYSYSY